MKKTGVLLINLGTPSGPGTREVRRFLKQFLSDPRVIDLPTIARLILLYTVILPFRPKQSAKAYQAIWTQSGSPLMNHSLRLEHLVAQHLSKDFIVTSGMRYGSPSIADGIAQLIDQGMQHITVIILFPQYASSSFGSAAEAVYDAIRSKTNTPTINILPPFFADPGYISALSQTTAPHLLEPYDHLLMSFHGLPERHVIASDGHQPVPGCDRQKPCPALAQQNQYCYRAQCYTTARALAASLHIPEKRYTVSFQSRLGRAPWIKPYTDELLPSLYHQGVRKLAVVCPSFTADCLETLEEIGIRLTKTWSQMGGQECRLIPCLNTDPHWVKTISQWITTHQPQPLKTVEENLPLTA